MPRVRRSTQRPICGARMARGGICNRPSPHDGPHIEAYNNNISSTTRGSRNNPVLRSAIRNAMTAQDVSYVIDETPPVNTNATESCGVRIPSGICNAPLRHRGRHTSSYLSPEERALRLNNRRNGSASARSVASNLNQIPGGRVSRNAWLAKALESKSYQNDMSAFQAVYDRTKQKIRDGEQPVPYLYENATGGLGSRGSGRPFGVEIEIDGVTRQQKQQIINEMRAAGLTRNTGQVTYHEAQRRGYSDARDSWSIEEDCTVAAEIVSPILYDEPQTWEDLEKVCEIIKRHGGRATTRTGSHVHVGTPNAPPETLCRILGTVKAYEDELYRLASNPVRGSHRLGHYCVPNTRITGYDSVALDRVTAGHNSAVNLDHSISTRGHTEFRLWDGSIDPSVIQAQINLSLAITDYAYRETGEPTPRIRERPLGAATSEGRDALRGEAWKNRTANFRELVDSIFNRDENKEQITALFTATKWQHRRR